MKRILVPTDFSVHAEHALKTAAKIAKKNKSKIILIHMLELPMVSNDAVTRAREMPELILFKNKAVERLNSILSASYLEGIELEKMIQFEMAFEGIIESAIKKEVDLIVMGSHGASGFQEMFIGSNTEKVVRNSTIPVLVVKENTDFKVDNFVFASDFSEAMKEPFKKAVAFAKAFDAHLHLLTVNTPNNFKSTRVAKKILADFVADFDLENYSTHIYSDINVEKGILHFANDIDADLIGMSTHGRKGLSHFLNGSISEDLVNHAQKSVITFKI